MRVTYLKLENVAGLSVGSDKKSIEIRFEKSRNKIVAIQGANGVGKTVLLSSLTPFAYVTSLDERSSLSYIIPKKSGYKEIHYQNGEDTFIIKHYYKPTKDDSHSVKSYFTMNGEELNENGNVTSFLSLVELHFGLTQEMMRLVRLGTNVNSFITLAPAKRKEYIGKLIEEVDMYMRIYKGINEDIRVARVLLQSNNQNLYNCHISDPIVERQTLENLTHDIAKLEKERDHLISKIGKIQALMNDNDINELRRRRKDAEASIIDFERTEASVREMHLEDVSVDQLIKKRAELSDSKVDIQAKINSYRISIDNTLKTIERLELSVKKITSNNNVQSLIDAIADLRARVTNVSPMIRDFKPSNSTSAEISGLIGQLASFNQIGNMIQTFGSKPIEVYLRLKRSGKSVDKFIKDQAKKVASRLNDTDLRALLDQVFEDEMVISPACDTQYMVCPYYRLSGVLTEMKDRLEEESYDSETLRYIQIISNNIDNILNELDRSRRIKLPDKIRDELNEKTVIDRMGAKLPFFDLTGIQEYLSIITEWESFQSDKVRLKEYERQLAVYRQSGVDTHLAEIENANKSIEFYRKNIATLSGEIQSIEQKLTKVDTQIGIVTKYLDGKKYRKVVQSTLDSTKKILEPLERASNEKTDLEYQLRAVNTAVQQRRQDHKILEGRLNEYDRLLEEGARLDKEFKDLNAILKAVSTRKGIPVIFMKKYLGKIQQLANNLLQLIYDDDLQLARFEVDQDTFEVPYLKNGTKIKDVRFASQSEVALITMALSFALANRASGAYNILLLDEIDAGLDEANRSAFLKMLYMQMGALKAEQVFIISHNLTQMLNVPMDCIKLSDTGVQSKLQNIIYE